MPSRAAAAFLATYLGSAADPADNPPMGDCLRAHPRQIRVRTNNGGGNYVEIGVAKFPQQAASNIET